MEINSKKQIKQGGQDELSSPPDNVLEEGSLEGLVDDVLGKKLADVAEMQMNHAVLDLLDRFALLEKERAKDRQGDQAEFSNDSIAYSRSGEKDPKDLELLLDRLWAMLEEWQPQPETSLTQEIIQLKEIYQKLLETILDACTNDQAGMQADKINYFLLHMIEAMGKDKFPNLLQLLEKYGNAERADFLRASVMEKITGKMVSPQDIAAARERNVSGNKDVGTGFGGVRSYEGGSGRSGAYSGRTGMGGAHGGGTGWGGAYAAGSGRGGAYGTGSGRGGAYSGGLQPGKRSAVLPNGILYSREGKGIHANHRYMEQVWEAERFSLPSAGKRRTDAESGGFHFQGKLYSVTDIEQGERFVRYLNGKGNLYCNPELTGKSEELLGFLMAVNMEKVHIFGEFAGVGNRMSMDISNALERFFRYCVSESMAAASARLPGSHGGARLDIRLVQRMYYRVMEIIQRMKAPGKGIEKGLKYAYESYYSGKVSKEQDASRQEPGFFGGCGDLRDNEKELKSGSRVLDRDWKEFLSSIGQDNHSFLQMALSNCPWGVDLEGEKTPGGRGTPGPAMFLILAGAVVGLFLIRFVF